MTALLSTEGLTMRFGDFTAVDHVSFRIRRGRFSALKPDCGWDSSIFILPED